MKRDPSYFTKAHIERLKGWLKIKTEQDKTCPFRGMPDSWCARVCGKAFPSIDPGTCPCPELGLTYTKRIARKIIKELS